MNFKKYANFFRFVLTETPSIELPSVEKEQDKINKRVQSIIEDQNVEMLTVLINNDYLFTKKQLVEIIYPANSSNFINLNEKLKEHLYTRNWNQLNEVLDESLSNFYNLLITGKIFFQDKEMYGSYRVRDNSISDMHNYIKSLNILSGNWAVKLYENDIDRVLNVYNTVKKHADFSSTTLSGKSMNMHVSTLSQEQSKFRDYFKKLHDRLFESVFVNMAQRSNIVALQDIKENITNELSHHIKNFNIKSLPLLTQSTLNSINETYSDILNYKDIITLTQKLDCDNLYSKRVPQVIAEYISIPEKYRERLSSSVDSPDKLVHENLEEIKEKLTIILDNLNEQSIQNMKKTKKYLKTI